MQSRFQVQCCFMSTETIRIIRDLLGWAQGGHLGFHTAPELLKKRKKKKTEREREVGYRVV